MADFLTIAHKCSDFGAWKVAYDRDAPNRAAAGLTDLLLARNMDTPDLVGLVLGVADRAKALAFGASDALRETMAAAGITSPPAITLREGDFAPPPAGASLFLTLNCGISGIARFRSGYAMDAADRAAAGMTDLGLMTAVDDPHNLFLFWSIEDVDRVKRLMASPDLARHQVENVGVTSPPVLRFWTA